MKEIKKQLLFYGLIVSIMPVSASAEPIATLLQNAVTLLTSTWASWGAILVAGALGWLMWAGYFTSVWLLRFVGGCAFVFGAAGIVGLFSNVGGGGGLGIGP